MKVSKLVKDYSRLSEANLNFKAQMVIVNLTDNPRFPITTPRLSEFTAIKEAFSQALQDSDEGGKVAVAIKN